jgi:hypothetical protein
MTAALAQAHDLAEIIALAASGTTIATMDQVRHVGPRAMHFRARSGPALKLP